ncbi:MAG TPA: hypothetical protein DD658_06185 [Deltaproteobacteria bacterium]|nr:hypothetical protein [Deltaproteobacteria bacterium]
MVHPYPKMKDSGVEWLGEVPEHWGVKRLKGVVKINPEVLPETTPPDHTIVYVDISSVEEVEGVANSREIEFSEAPSRARRIVRPGDTILSTVRTYLKAVAHFEAPLPNLIVSTGFAVLRPNNLVFPKFLYYMVRCEEFVQAVVAHSVGVSYPAINPSELSALAAWIPSPEEQRAVASFLDRKTTLNDDLIAKRERQIELLQEQRTALISRSVTKGLNPDVPMKESGVEWIGKVPGHWAVKALKWESPVFRGASPRPIDNPIYFDEQGEYAWVRISDVTSAGMYLDVTEQRLSDLGSSLSVKLEPGRIFLSIAGSVGKPCITQIKCCIHDGFVYFPMWKGNTKFLYYVFASGEPYKGLGKMGTQLNLNTDTVGAIILGVPCVEEQNEIADYLDRETAKIDAFVSKVQQSIEKLREYRQSLISTAVTGKINVSERVVVPEVNVAVSETKWTAPPTFQRAVLATEIVHQLHREPTFGRVKFQKILHLSEHHVGADIDGNYYRQAAGPLDPKMIRSVESQMEKQKWYRAQKEDKGTKYVPLENAGRHRKYFDRYWLSRKERLDALINLLRSKNTEFCEIVDTLFAAWNDLIIASTEFDDGTIIKEFLGNWHESKKRFGEERLHETLRWMRGNGLVPTGRGKPTIMRG